jgi:thioredoxin-dependent peroxiredoxin
MLCVRMDIGTIAPDFALPSQSNDTVSLRELLGKGPVVVFFYPKDETAVCTKEACAFRDAYADLQAAGASVVGISSDDVASHQRFAAKHRLPYPILADSKGQVRRSWKVPRAMLGLVDGRSTYVLDASGTVRHSHDGAMQSQQHVDEALAAVKRIKDG